MSGVDAPKPPLAPVPLSPLDRATEGEDTPSFDPEVGAQDLSTGLVGAAQMVLLLIAWAVFRMLLAKPDAPPPTLWWLPASLTSPHWGREVLVLWGILASGALTMAAWEIFPHPAQRRQLRTDALLAVGLVMAVVWWSLRQGSEGDLWFPLDPLWLTQDPRRLTVFEGVLALTLMGRVTLVSFLAWRSVAQWPSRAAWRRAVRTGCWRWAAGLALAFLLLWITFSLNWPGAGSWRLSADWLFTAYALLGLPYAVVTNLRPATVVENMRDLGFGLLLLGRVSAAAARGRTAGLGRLVRRRSARVLAGDMAVKMFFAPLMVVSFFANAEKFADSFVWRVSAVTPAGAEFSLLWDRWYPCLLFGLGLLDVTVGLLGYFCASRWLSNKTRSVDGTLDGWLVALVCYPPLNVWISSYMAVEGGRMGRPLVDFQRVPGLADASAAALNGYLEIAVGVVCVAAFAVYGLATVAFGLRFSNMTHRGIITRGPYAYVRHPAYVSKVVGWWALNLMRFTSVLHVIAMVGWSAIYLGRALTEERHLLRFDDYQAYARRVPRRFFPGGRPRGGAEPPGAWGGGAEPPRGGGPGSCETVTSP